MRGEGERAPRDKILTERLGVDAHVYSEGRTRGSAHRRWAIADPPVAYRLCGITEHTWGSPTNAPERVVGAQQVRRWGTPVANLAPDLDPRCPRVRRWGQLESWCGLTGSVTDLSYRAGEWRARRWCSLSPLAKLCSLTHSAQQWWGPWHHERSRPDAIVLGVKADVAQAILPHCYSRGDFSPGGRARSRSAAPFPRRSRRLVRGLRLLSARAAERITMTTGPHT
jgi:hypothetical protein